jgi:hypothetical protein
MTIFIAMKKILLATIIILTAATTFGQNGSGYIRSGSIGKVQPAASEAQKNEFPYGPVKYRTLEETIGETYLVLPLSKYDLDYGYFNLYEGDTTNDPNRLSKEKGDGLLITLASLQNDIAHFIDSSGKKYAAKLIDASISDVVPVYDIEQSRKLFLNKTLWMKRGFLFTYDDATGDYGKITGTHLDPVKVIDIVGGANQAFPVRFIVKTAEGETGFADVIVSGTNADLIDLKEYSFDKIFFAEDPHKTYHFTPKVWQMVKEYDTPIGIPMEAFKLVKGTPNAVNTLRTAKSVRQQWIYNTIPRSYYYFENGKLVASN